MIKYEIYDEFLNRQDFNQLVDFIMPRGHTPRTKDIHTINDVTWDFVIQGDFNWDWLAFGCKNDKTGETFIIEPSYPKGLPEELEGVVIDRQFGQPI